MIFVYSLNINKNERNFYFGILEYSHLPYVVMLVEGHTGIYFWICFN